MSSGEEEPPIQAGGEPSPQQPQQVDPQESRASGQSSESTSPRVAESASSSERPSNEDEDEAPFEDANENEFEQYFVNQEASDDDDDDDDGDDNDHDDFFFDEDDEDVDEEVDAVPFEVDEIDDDNDDDDDDDNEANDDLDAFDDDDDDDDDDDEDIFGLPQPVNNDEYDNVQEVQVNYDTELPSTHNYLGTNFEEVAASKHVHASNDEIELPLLPLPGNAFYENSDSSDSSYTQLIPGQIMPIFFYSPLHIQVIRRRMRDHNPTVGFVLSPRSLRGGDTSSSSLAHATNQSSNPATAADTQGTVADVDPKLGIIAEIISVSNHNPDSPIEHATSILDSGTGIVLKIKGRERFRIVRLRKDITGCFVAKVRILPEYVLDENPLLRQAARVRSSEQAALSLFLHKPCCDGGGGGGRGESCSLTKAEQLNTQLNQPAWLYRFYDCSYLVYMIKRELETLGQKVNFESASSDMADASACSSSNSVVNDSNDALVFSYWLLSNFPFDNDMRINCLQMDCINQRLIYMFSLLRNFTNISCRKCEAVFCTKHDVFSISKQGFMSAYLNPGGVVHETLTVFKLKNFSMTGARPSTQSTWFPGYGWQICYCCRCNSHIGWKFTPAKPNLKPDKFWGLTRTAIKYTYNTASSAESTSSVKRNDSLNASSIQSGGQDEASASIAD